MDKVERIITIMSAVIFIAFLAVAFCLYVGCLQDKEMWRLLLFTGTALGLVVSSYIICIFSYRVLEKRRREWEQVVLDKELSRKKAWAEFELKQCKEEYELSKKMKEFEFSLAQKEKEANTIRTLKEKDEILRRAVKAHSANLTVTDYDPAK